MHIVDQAKPEQRLQRAAPENRLFVRMDDFVAMLDQQADGPQDHEQVEHHLLERRADGNRSRSRNFRNPHDSHTGERDVLTLPVGEQIDSGSAFHHDERPIVDAERRSARREKRLRCDHEYTLAHPNLCTRFLTFIATCNHVNSKRLTRDPNARGE